MYDPIVSSSKLLFKVASTTKGLIYHKSPSSFILSSPLSRVNGKNRMKGHLKGGNAGAHSFVNNYIPTLPSSHESMKEKFGKHVRVAILV